MEPTAATWAGPVAEDVHDAPAQLPAGYVLRGVLGRGGMGVVYRATDEALGREVALKFLQHRHLHNAEVVARFRAESRVMASLDHPGVVAVFASGEVGGRPWYAMRVVHGRTLGEVLRSGETGDVGLLRAVRDTARALAFAHGHGVVHCDVKPDNVVIGPFGEVQVLDWGISERVGTSARMPGLGTDGFRAPEQGSSPVSSAWDVFALGSLLARVLEAVPAEDLGRLAARCTNPMASERPTAAEVAEQVEAWLQSEEARRQAQDALHRARALAAATEASRARSAAMRDEAERLLASLPSDASVARKIPAWEVLDEAERLDLDGAAAEAEVLRGLHTALELCPTLDAAHEALAEHHHHEAQAALGTGDRLRGARHRALLAVHDRGRYRAFVQGIGQLTLHTDLAGLKVHISPMRVEHRRQVPGPPVSLGRTPLNAVSVPAGSLLLHITTALGSQLRVPLFVPAGEHVVHRRPGDNGPTPVRTTGLDALGPDECWVPGGWFISGGDGRATDGLTRRRLWVDDLIVQRLPITNAQYLAFLDDLVAQGKLEEALSLAPRRLGDVADGMPVMRFDGQRFQLGEHMDGGMWHLDWPVTLVSVDAARAYAAHVATPERAWRLAHDQELEKAARGVDGRSYPWGEHFEPSWARVLASAGSPPRPAGMHEHPEDCSVYGVRHVAGNVRVWCDNAYDRAGPADGSVVVPQRAGADAAHIFVRGGAWSNAADLSRVASRFAGPPDGRYTATGIRLVRTP